MIARLMKDEIGNFFILCKDGTIAEADKETLNKLLTSFHLASEITGDASKRWDREYPEMSMYPGEECAMITDTLRLVLTDFTPFHSVYTADVPNLISSVAYAKRMGKSTEQIKILCRNGRIPGAMKVGRDWLIPANAPYPKSPERKQRR